MVTLNSTLTINTNSTLTTNMNGEVVILDTVNGKYFGLDGIGAQVWEMLENHQTIPQIKAAILEEYDVDEQQCEQDLMELLNGLNDAGLVITS